MKRTISIGAVLIVIAAFLYASRAPAAPPIVSASTLSSATMAPQSAPLARTTPEPAATVTPASAPSTAPRAAANAALIVGTTTYPVSVSSSETVIDAMRALAKADNTFTFTGRDYPSLGFFVDSINGKGNAGGRYWMLYVNGISASAGASSVAVKAGDTVAWRYEKGQ